MSVYIRVDGNNAIGTGHVMRCLSIAEKMRICGKTCVFICADNKMQSLILGKGYKCIVLDTQWNDLESEIEDLILVLKQQGAKKLIIDSYYVTQLYLSAIRSFVKIFYIDDLNLFLYPCDFLLNYNIYADGMYQENQYADTTLLLGPEYFPIREEFLKLDSYKPRETVRNIVITTGGTDSLGVSLSLAYAFSLDHFFDNVVLHFVIGTFNPYIKDLQKIANNHKNIIIHVNTNKISTLFSNADIAISAGGTTVYELCYVGVPTILYSIADNQFNIVNTFSEKKMMRYTGDYRKNKRKTICNILDDTKVYMSNYKLRDVLSKKLQATVDGKGTYRIMKYL